MKLNKALLKRHILLSIPYLLIALLSTKLSLAWRTSTGTDVSKHTMHFLSVLGAEFQTLRPSFHPVDLLFGTASGAMLRLAVYVKGRNAKKYRHNEEYGSARWGTPKNIAPFENPVFSENIILTKTERLTMSSRPKNPKYARNKNVLIVGGSGSGKTRYWLKPNLLHMHSSYVVTDPKGSIVTECGHALLHFGYRLEIFNTINFQKSMHYNPFAYIHSEKDILKLVNTLIANTKGARPDRA